jgi:hypothetical protein
MSQADLPHRSLRGFLCPLSSYLEEIKVLKKCRGALEVGSREEIQRKGGRRR